MNFKDYYELSEKADHYEFALAHAEALSISDAMQAHFNRQLANVLAELESADA